MSEDKPQDYRKRLSVELSSLFEDDMQMNEQMMGDHHPMDGGYYPMDPYQQQGMHPQQAQHGGYVPQYCPPQPLYDPNFQYNMGGHPQPSGHQWYDSDL